MGVPKTAENKEGAVEYIKWIFGSEDGAIAQRDFKGNFSPYKPVYEQEGFYSESDPYFGGQDVLSAHRTFFQNMAEVRRPSKYDQDINDVYNLALKSINADTEGTITVDELIDSMTEELLVKQPDLEK